MCTLGGDTFWWEYNALTLGVYIYIYILWLFVKVVIFTPGELKP